MGPDFDKAAASNVLGHATASAKDKTEVSVSTVPSDVEPTSGTVARVRVAIKVTRQVKQYVSVSAEVDLETPVAWSADEPNEFLERIATLRDVAIAELPGALDEAARLALDGNAK